VETKIILFVYNIMKGGNTDSKAPEVQGFDYDNVEQYGTVNLTGGKGKGKGKSKSKSSKFSEFDFEKEWKEFEESYNQKYGGASKKKKPAKKTSSSTKKKPTKKASSAKKPKRKTQRGGDEAGATYAPAQFFDEKATMSAPSSDKSTGSLVDGLYPHAPNNQVVAQTGGAKKKKSSKTKKAKTATKTTKPKKDTKKKDSKKDTKKDSKKDTKSTGKKTSVLDKIKKFFAM
jgi:hypothetical protein